MKRILSACAGAVLMVSPPGQATAETNTILLSAAYLNELAEVMRTNHPALRAAASQVRAAELATDAVRTWEDPELILGGQFAEQDLRADEGDILYGVEQPLPLFGKAAAVRSAAGAAAAVKVAEADLRFQFMRRDLAIALFRTAESGHIVRASEEDLDWLTALAANARARHAAGDGPQMDVLRIENELARRSEEVTTDRRMREHERLALNRFLNRPLDAPWPELQLPAPAPAIHYNRRVVSLATRFEPMLQVFRAQLEAAQAESEVARRSYRPDVRLGLEGRSYSGIGGTSHHGIEGGDFRQAMVTFSVTLPWLNRSKYRADIARAEAARETVERELVDRELATHQEVHELVIRIDDARRRALRYRDEILPRTRAMFDTAHAAWVAGTGMTRELLELRRMLVETGLDYHRAVAAQYEAMVELVLCCGLGDLEALEMIGANPDAVSEHPPATNSPTPAQP